MYEKIPLHRVKHLSTEHFKDVIPLSSGLTLSDVRSAILINFPLCIMFIPH